MFGLICVTSSQISGVRLRVSLVITSGMFSNVHKMFVHVHVCSTDLATLPQEEIFANLHNLQAGFCRDLGCCYIGEFDANILRRFSLTFQCSDHIQHNV